MKRAGQAVAVLAAVAVGIAAAAGVLHARDERHPLPVSEDRLMYLRSGRTADRVFLSFDAIASDVYWIRTIQHYGRDLGSTRTTGRFELLNPLLGATVASALFAVALLFSGQNATLTGTLAGQIVMEGFLNIRLRPWLRRLITRLIAIVPAVIVIAIKGEEGSGPLLVLSQVILSLQLPFAIFPLVQFTSNPKMMGPFASKTWIKALAWPVCLIIAALNVYLLYQTAIEFFGS